MAGNRQNRRRNPEDRFDPMDEGLFRERGEDADAAREASERLRHIDELIDRAVSSDSQHFLDSFVQEGGE